MHTNKDFSIFGIFIPAGTKVTDTTDSCAVVAIYDEKKGCSFNKKAKYAKPKNGDFVAIPRSYAE
jgi:hypothetical protein